MPTTYIETIGPEFTPAHRTARKDHVCTWCGDPIVPGDRYWLWTTLLSEVGGDFAHYKEHDDCADYLGARSENDVPRLSGTPVCYGQWKHVRGMGCGECL